jgi:hypothetical protein
MQRALRLTFNGSSRLSRHGRGGMGYTIKVALLDDLIEGRWLCRSLCQHFTCLKKTQNVYLHNIRDNSIAEPITIARKELGKLFAFFRRTNGTNHCNNIDQVVLENEKHDFIPV